MYSGFYQHEIAANLMGAEVLFEEMGYRTMPNQTLVLEGPICPDRVTNVSKDAITANVECQVTWSRMHSMSNDLIIVHLCLQIMINIYRGLTEMSLRVNWSDIYNFRERNTSTMTNNVRTEMRFKIYVFFCSGYWAIYSTHGYTYSGKASENSTS